MSKRFFHFLIIINLLIPFSAYSIDERCLENGDYISETFIGKIQNGFSLEKASYGLDSIFASVLQEENNLRIGLSNFHDSVFLYILPDCRTIKDVEKYLSNYVFERIDKDSFKIHNDKEDILFKYVGNDYNDWLAIQIFSGKWGDQSGNSFIFNKDGKVSLNDTVSNYTIGNQVHGREIGIVYDIVKIGNNNYAFKISNSKLFLYEAFEWDISKEPKYILNFIKKSH